MFSSSSSFVLFLVCFYQLFASFGQPSMLEYTNARLDHITASLLSITQGRSSMNAAAAPALLPLPSLPFANTTPSTPLNVSSNSSVPPPSSPSPLQPSKPLPSTTTPQQKQKTRTITLAGGLRVEFTANDIGLAPLISFADDLPKLNRMWDDISPYWDGRSALLIKGLPIPIVYWKSVYGRTKSGGLPLKADEWRGLKGRWSEWKVSFRHIHALTS